MAEPNLRMLQRRELRRLLTSAAGERLLDELAAEVGTNATVIVLVLIPTATVVDLPQTAHRLAARAVTNGCDRGRRTALILRRREVCKTQDGLAAEIGVLRSTVA